MLQLREIFWITIAEARGNWEDRVGTRFPVTTTPSPEMIPWIGLGGDLQGKLAKVCANMCFCTWSYERAAKETAGTSHGSERSETFPGRLGEVTKPQFTHMWVWQQRARNACMLCFRQEGLGWPHIGGCDFWVQKAAWKGCRGSCGSAKRPFTPSDRGVTRWHSTWGGSSSSWQALWLEEGPQNDRWG